MFNGISMETLTVLFLGVFDTPLLAALPQKAIDAVTKTVVFPQRLGKPDEFCTNVSNNC